MSYCLYITPCGRAWCIALSIILVLLVSAGLIYGSALLHYYIILPIVEDKSLALWYTIGFILGEFTVVSSIATVISECCSCYSCCRVMCVETQDELAEKMQLWN